MYCTSVLSRYILKTSMHFILQFLVLTEDHISFSGQFAKKNTYLWNYLQCQCLNNSNTNLVSTSRGTQSLQKLSRQTF